MVLVDDDPRLTRGACEREPELEPNSGLVDLDAAMVLVRARIEWEREEDRRRREPFVALDARGAALRASLPSVFRGVEGRGLRALTPFVGAALLVASLGANAFAYVRVQAHERALVGALAERRAATRPTFAEKAPPKPARLVAVETPREGWPPPEPSVSASPPEPKVALGAPSTLRVPRRESSTVNRGSMAVKSPAPRDPVGTPSSSLDTSSAVKVAAHDEAPTLPVSPPAPADLGAAMRAAVGLASAAPERAVPVPAQVERERTTNPDARQLRPAPGAIVSALRAVQDAARACLAEGDSPRVHAVVFGPDGRVLRVEAQLRDEKTPCIDSALSRARVDAFSEEGYRAKVTVRP